MAWKGTLFSGLEVFQNDYAISVEMTSNLNNNCWILTTIYAPCTPIGKRTFLNWFKDIQMSDHIDWIIVGDFNLIRRPEDRNKPGGDVTEMYLFNEAINYLGLIELPLLGRHFTWTNKQLSPLLKRLDWFFTSVSWTGKYPGTLVKPMVMKTSDHWPCVVEINTDVPRSHVFRFENHWLDKNDFITILLQGWEAHSNIQDLAKIITAKCENLKQKLKHWKKNFPL